VVFVGVLVSLFGSYLRDLLGYLLSKVSRGFRLWWDTRRRLRNALVRRLATDLNRLIVFATTVIVLVILFAMSGILAFLDLIDARAHGPNAVDRVVVFALVACQLLAGYQAGTGLRTLRQIRRAIQRGMGQAASTDRPA
jgi:hypothetical protein